MFIINLGDNLSLPISVYRASTHWLAILI